jgi:hypothetical protein
MGAFSRAVEDSTPYKILAAGNNMDSYNFRPGDFCQEVVIGKGKYAPDSGVRGYEHLSAAEFPEVQEA